VALVGAEVRLALDLADRLRDALKIWAHGGNSAGIIFVTRPFIREAR
jgi:hypothetical protein